MSALPDIPIHTMSEATQSLRASANNARTHACVTNNIYVTLLILNTTMD